MISDTTPALPLTGEISGLPRATNRKFSPAPAHALSHGQRGLIIAVALIAVLAKAYCALTTFGSGDVILISSYGQAIDLNGLDYLYLHDWLFNHPPLAASFFWILYDVSAAISHIGIYGVPKALPFLLRLPSVLADFLSVLILLKIHGRTGKPTVAALILFAASPAAFMVAGFHGNTDSIMVCLLLASAYFCIAENAIVCGVLLGLCCNVKIIPLLLTPIFFFFWLHRGPGKATRFFLAFALFCLAGWSAALIGEPYKFFKNVLCYPSFPGAWGITFWYSVLADYFHLTRPGVSPFQNIPWFLTGLKLAIIALIILLGWMRRKRSGIEMLGTITLAWIFFMVLAPGFIPYYLIWLAPFLVCYSPVWYVIVTITSSVYLFAYYNIMSHGLPWNVADLRTPPTWPVWGILPWFAMLVMAAMAVPGLLRQFRKSVPTPG